MLLTHTYVRGEDQLNKLLAKMGRQKARFTESFAHVDEITIEHIQENPGDGYHSYYILYMPHPNGTGHMSDIRSMVHQQIRDGETNMKRL